MVSRKKLINVEESQIIKWIEDDCTITLKKIKQKLKQDFQTQVSTSTIQRLIHEFYFSMKTIRLESERRNDEETIETRFEYANQFLQKISQINDESLIFDDETGFSISMKRKRGRSKKGAKAIKIVENIRTRNISICCAMNKNKIFKFEIKDRAYNQENFIDFLSSLFQLFNEEQIGNATLVMDNVPFHKTKKVKEFVEERGYTLLFLPPYSPFLNPIENLFSKWKNFVKLCNQKDEVQLMRLINEGTTIITKADCNNFYRNMIGYIHLCLSTEKN